MACMTLKSGCRDHATTATRSRPRLGVPALAELAGTFHSLRRRASPHRGSSAEVRNEMQRLSRALRLLQLGGTVRIRFFFTSLLFVAFSSLTLSYCHTQANLRSVAEASSQTAWGAAAAGPSSVRSWGEAASQSWADHGRRSLHSSAVAAALQPRPRGNQPPPHPWTQVGEKTERESRSCTRFITAACGSVLNELFRVWVAGGESTWVRERRRRGEPIHANEGPDKEEDPLQTGGFHHAGESVGGHCDVMVISCRIWNPLMRRWPLTMWCNSLPCASRSRWSTSAWQSWLPRCRFPSSASETSSRSRWRAVPTQQRK